MVSMSVGLGSLSVVHHSVAHYLGMMKNLQSKLHLNRQNYPLGLVIIVCAVNSLLLLYKFSVVASVSNGEYVNGV